VAENDHLPLTWHIALTTVYALTCYTVIVEAMVQLSVVLWMIVMTTSVQVSSLITLQHVKRHHCSLTTHGQVVFIDHVCVLAGDVCHVSTCTQMVGRQCTSCYLNQSGSTKTDCGTYINHTVIHNDITSSSIVSPPRTCTSRYPPPVDSTVTESNLPVELYSQ